MDPQDSRNFTESDLESMLLDEAAEPRAMPFSLLEKITNGFSYKQEIGRGGFAVVYKAILENGAVAVKKLYNTYMYESEFQREVECLMKVKHKNIVRFLGYCSDTQGNMQKYNGKFIMAEVQERLLCFEYLPEGSLDRYIQDASGGLEWTTRYQIISGICEGLHSLHHINIMHLDLKPANILLGDNLTPKITDFGLSRSLEELQTRVVATKMFGTMGYLAPEFASHVITHKFDLYSLGVIIMEILTGHKDHQAIENIHESWKERLELSQRNSYLEQIKVCTDIAIECTNIDPSKRPTSMKHVMDILAEMDRRHAIERLQRRAEMERLAEMEYDDELHLLKYRFYPHCGEYIPCLHLTNKTDERVVFRLIDRSSKEVWVYTYRMYGAVPPRSTCILIWGDDPDAFSKDPADLVLESSTAGAKNSMILESDHACDHFFEEAKELGHAVCVVALNNVYTPSEPAVRPTKIKLTIDTFLGISSMDAHPTEPWIILGYTIGSVDVWNHERKIMVNMFEIENSAISIKFDATKKWIVAKDGQQVIHVYDCACITQIEKIASFNAPSSNEDYSVAIHPSKPYVLSSMKLWDGDKGWDCTHTFGNGGVNEDVKWRAGLQLAFNPENPNSFASATMGHNYVEVWSLDSPEPDYTLNGHSHRVNCLAFFKRSDGQYLITGSDDCTAKVWDLQTKVCIHTMEALMYPVLHVISLPGRPYLVICTKSCTIHVWSSVDFRIKTTVNLSRVGNDVVRVACLNGSRRIAIAQGHVVSIMDIDDKDEEEAVPTDGNNENSGCVTGQSSNP